MALDFNIFDILPLPQKALGLPIKYWLSKGGNEKEIELPRKCNQVLKYQ
jgi:anti-sigma factor ChrR (cupin superfamily)